MSMLWKKLKLRVLNQINRYRQPGRSVLRTYPLNGTSLKIYDDAISTASDMIFMELSADCYQLKRIPFKPGDVVIDIGAHVGLFSIYLAKRYPEITIYAFEPVPLNIEHFKRNMELNHITNIELFECGISQKLNHLNLVMHPSNTGGATAFVQEIERPKHHYLKVDTITMEQLFSQKSIQQCRLLKIDCEGAEYDILLNTSVLEQVEYLSGEFHINSFLQKQGYSIEQLIAYCQRFIPAEHLAITACQMAE